MIAYCSKIPLVGLMLPVFVCCGCCSKPAVGPEPAPFDPEESGRLALSEYDKDGSGGISKEEAAASPSLASAFARIDKNADGQISKAESVERVEYLLNSLSRIITGSTEVTLDGKPLMGATVTLEPEPFMGQAFKPVSGITDERGNTLLSGHHEKFPGIFLGYYRVRISKEVNGKETLPARYNTESELGYEAADDVDERMMLLRFDLTSS